MVKGFFRQTFFSILMATMLLVGCGSQQPAHGATGALKVSAIEAGNIVHRVGDLTELKALKGSLGRQAVYLEGRATAGDGGEGSFRWLSGDQSANAAVVADTREGIYVRPASPGNGSTGVWVRQRGQVVDINWFGSLSGTNAENSAVLAAAISSISSGDTFLLKGKTFGFQDAPIFKDLSNVLVDLTGTTMTGGADFYENGNIPYNGMNAMLFVQNCERVNFIGGVFDGNKANQTTGNINGLQIDNSNWITIEGMTFQNHGYHATVLYGTNGAAKNVNFSRCLWKDNYGVQNNSDVYSSNSEATGVFSGCWFERDYSTWAAGSIDDTQAFYIHAGSFTFENLDFLNIPVPLDIRDGKHIIKGIKVDNCTWAMIQRATSGTMYPRTFVKDLDAVNVRGQEGIVIAGFTVQAGEMDGENIRIKVHPTEGAGMTYGVLLRGSFYTIGNVTLKNVVVDGASSTGVRLQDTAGETTLQDVTVKNSNYGFTSAGNTGKALVINPIYENIATSKISSTDNCITVFSYRQSTATVKQGTASFSGDGANKQFSINHDFGSYPTSAAILPGSVDAVKEHFVQFGSATINIIFTAAPPAGTDNVKFYYRIED